MNKQLMAGLILLPLTLQAHDIQIQPNTNPPHQAYEAFSKVVEIFGVKIFATKRVSDAKILHAANVLAQYLDNDEDGQPDHPDVIEVMTRKQPAHLLMFETERVHERSRFDDKLSDRWFDTHTLQTLYGDETFEERGQRLEEFDPTLEEVWHLVSSGGFHFAQPKVFGEQKGSLLSAAMKEAIKGKFYRPEANERGLPHIIKVSEYFYWLLTSALDGQNLPGRFREIHREWKLNTPDKIRKHNPQGWDLVSNPRYNMPTRVPDGHYTPEMSTEP